VGGTGRPDPSRRSPSRRAARGPRRLHVVVTAGPTREWWDPVRFLSNASSGRMGIACAEAATRRGHRVTLVRGPCEVPDPPGTRVVPVETALEMQAALRAVFPRCDGLLMTAAVADYRPLRPRSTKAKKGSRTITLRLVRNPDLLYDVGREKGDRTLIGFALEDRDPRRRALAKLRKKRLDYIVLNGPRVIGRDRTSVTILGPDGPLRSLRGVTKRRLAETLVRLLERDQDARRAQRG